MALLKDRDPSQKHKALYWGKSGVGKSELLGTYAEAGLMAVAELDPSGLDVLRSKGFRERHPHLDIGNLVDAEAFYNVLDDYGIPSSHNALWNMQKWLNEKIRDPRVVTVAIDSMTSLSNIIEPLAVHANSERKLSNSQKYMNSTHVLSTMIQDKGVESNIMVQILTGIMRADKNVIILAHEREKVNDAGIITGVEPNMTGTRARANIGNIFREVCYLDIESITNPKYATDKTQPEKIDVRLLRTRPTGQIKIAKTTIGIPDRLVNPTYARIMKAIGG